MSQLSLGVMRFTGWAELSAGAAGHYRKYAASIFLSHAAVHRGVHYFSRMRLRYDHGGQRDYGYRWGTYPGATVPLWIGGPGS